jgi:hypothetical protein
MLLKKAQDRGHASKVKIENKHWSLQSFWLPSEPIFKKYLNVMLWLEIDNFLPSFRHFEQDSIVTRMVS